MCDLRRSDKLQLLWSRMGVVPWGPPVRLMIMKGCPALSAPRKTCPRTFGVSVALLQGESRRMGTLCVAAG
jgi:hypothetical protein